MLVYLDGIDKEIAAFITEGFTRTFERRVNRTQAMLQDLRKTEQRRQTLVALFLQLLNQLSQIDARLWDVGIRTNRNMTQFVDVIIVATPVGDVISTQHFAGITIIHGNLLHRTQMMVSGRFLRALAEFVRHAELLVHYRGK